MKDSVMLGIVAVGGLALFSACGIVAGASLTDTKAEPKPVPYSESELDVSVPTNSPVLATEDEIDITTWEDSVDVSFGQYDLPHEAWESDQKGQWYGGNRAVHVKVVVGDKEYPRYIANDGIGGQDLEVEFKKVKKKTPVYIQRTQYEVVGDAVDHDKVSPEHCNKNVCVEDGQLYGKDFRNIKFWPDKKQYWPIEKVTYYAEDVVKPYKSPKIDEDSEDFAWYKDCADVKRAGKAPIYKGDPGYSGKLDADGDGVGCEW